MAVSRNAVLAGLLALLLVLAYVVLAAVLQVIVFAITVAYVLFPLRERLRERGFSRRLSSAIVTVATFLAVVAVLVPIAFAVYQRSGELVEKLEALPETFSVEFGGMSHEVDVRTVQDTLEDIAQELAVEFAVAAPALVLAVVLFTFVLYGLLYRPRAPRDAIYGAVPEQHHDIVTRLHNRTRKVLFVLYVIQAATAAATFVIALVLFLALGYVAPIWLAIIAALLQFVPMVGPSILIVALAIADIAVFGMAERAVAVLVFGLLFVALLPDATIRPKLASRTGEFSSTLYFVGFVGGLLTLGAIGVIVGPLVIALLIEAVDILSEENQTHSQTTLTERGNDE